jgi:hypothetical protein
MIWTDSIHCRSRAHCRACRTDPAWRAQAGAPDECPIGLPIDAQDGYPERVAAQSVAMPSCRHCERTADRVPHRPCCVWIVCRMEDSPIFGQEKVQRSDWCRPERCRFFEAKTTE